MADYPSSNSNKEKFQAKETKDTGFNAKAEDAQNIKEYQKNLEGGKASLDFMDRATIWVSSFKIKLHLGLAVYLYIPLLLVLFAYLGRDFEELVLIIVPQATYSDVILTYTQLFYFSWIPELIFNDDGNLSRYISMVLSIIPLPPGRYSPSELSSAYMFFHLTLSLLITWIVTFIFYPQLLHRPNTLGEKWEYIFKKARDKHNQSLSDTARLQKSSAKITNLKPFLSEVEKGVTHFGQNYKNKFVHFLPVYKFFFNIEDSIRANMLAVQLNDRWEKIKLQKQEIQNKNKFIDLINSNFSFGDTQRSDIKRSILRDMPYGFIDIKGKIFHNKELIFSKENKPLLKRNAFILLSITVIFKNQIFPPLLRYLTSKHGIKYNAAEKTFISNTRKIFEEYRSTKKYFNEYIYYQLPVSLQYDYPYPSHGDISTHVSESINSLNTLQLTISGYVNEIDSLLPKTEDFDLPQPAFNSIFITNLTKIKELIVDYLVDRCSVHPPVIALSKSRPGAFKAMSYKYVNEVIIESLVKKMNLLKEPKSIMIFANGSFTEFGSPVIKINRATENLIIQQMSLSSYGIFKNELSTINIGIMNYTINKIYSSLSLTQTQNTSLYTITNKYKVYNTFNLISNFLSVKEKELKLTNE